MNEAIKRIKNAALAQASPEEKKRKYVLDTDQDEYDVADMMVKHGFGKDLVTTNKRNRYCRWDIEGEGIKIEVKTRTYTKPEWDTWVIDAYKVDYLMENYPEDELYFVNAYANQFHLYTMAYVSTCPKVKRYARFKDGKSGLRTFYEIPKDGWLMELATGETNDVINKL